MDSRYTISVNSPMCVITDNHTGGTLKIQQVLTEEYMDKMSESDLNPLIEFVNDLQEELDKNNLALNLIGNENQFVYFDDRTPILEGGITLKKVYLVNPFLANSDLRNVFVNKVEESHFSHSTVADFKHEIEGTERLHISHCFINETYPIKTSKKQTEFLMNICRNGEMW